MPGFAAQVSSISLITSCGSLGRGMLFISPFVCAYMRVEDAEKTSHKWHNTQYEDVNIEVQDYNIINPPFGKCQHLTARRRFLW